MPSSKLLHLLPRYLRHGVKESVNKNWRPIHVNASPHPSQDRKSRTGLKVYLDHRVLGTRFSLFATDPSCPGSPLFTPDGSHIFQKLLAFLRAQYPIFGLQEVITPTIYKEGLWAQSGHWENYKDDMFTVVGRGAQGVKDSGMQIGEDERYGLKPMNCPGHCLLFKSQKRSYRDLPIRYADFSPLHRNEISGSLTGLTRLRGFHQDDGHIFCRPEQVEKEILATLRLVRLVYRVFDLGAYRCVLSTRPKTGFIGTEEEWDRAEAQLKAALSNSKIEFQLNEGDGAFYGPKIDIMVLDKQRRTHQTATIQLDFQLPQRFNLGYQSPAPEQEAQGVVTINPELRNKVGMVTPVLIHRAILGSLERFMALLIERYQGDWPFWISPRQMIVLAVGNDEKVISYARDTVKWLTAPDDQGDIRNLETQTFTVHADLSDRSIAKKLVDARDKGYNIICIIGSKNLGSQKLTLSLFGETNSKHVWDLIERIQPGSQGPVQKTAAHVYRHMPGVQLTKEQCGRLMKELCRHFL